MAGDFDADDDSDFDDDDDEDSDFEESLEDVDFSGADELDLSPLLELSELDDELELDELPLELLDASRLSLR